MKPEANDIAGIIKSAIEKALAELSIPAPVEIHLERPAEFAHGDYSTNIALALAKKHDMAPRDLAAKLVEIMSRHFAAQQTSDVENIEMAGPGFINFHLTPAYFTQSIGDIVAAGDAYGKNTRLAGQKILIEYTDPNAFKVFHIGHLMSNAIGESIARLTEAAGAEVIRMCYPSDIGLHIAKAVWAMQKHEGDIPAESAPIAERTAFLGRMYVEGNEAYEAEDSAATGVKKEIEDINVALFEKSDAALNALHTKGRTWSFDHLEQIYKKVGTKFDDYIYESEVAEPGKEIVRKFTTHTGDMSEGAIFEESEGAVIFKGEKHGLHTRVFLNSKQLPTYEAKELGLNTEKFRRYPDLSQSIVITAAEINDYFMVLLRALALIDEKNGTHIAARTKHIGHGFLRLAAEGGGSTKMSSRKGTVITGESLIADVEKMVTEKIADRGFDADASREIVDRVAIGAIKYSILRSAAGSDIIFDFDKSLSFEGDSGPYLQYTHTRAQSVIEKAKAERLEPKADASTKSGGSAAEITPLEKLLVRFPETVERAGKEYSPHLLATYLIDLASAFNSYYANHMIIDAKDKPTSEYRLALTQSTATTLRTGLALLGIKVPEKM